MFGVALFSDSIDTQPTFSTWPTLTLRKGIDRSVEHVEERERAPAAAQLMFCDCL